MKPIGQKNYGSIPHLPSSRMGPADHKCHEGQERIACVKARDKHDMIYVTEKLDGSNVGIARVGNTIHALGRSGYLASTSPYEQHHMFAEWVAKREAYWLEVLTDGERLVGEWMAQAHGSRYSLPHGPFAAFDLMRGKERVPYLEQLERCQEFDIPVPMLLNSGEPVSVDTAIQALEALGGDHGCLDTHEGAVWRVERKGAFDFMVKWVRPDKKDGALLPEISGKEIVWNWKPERN